MISDWPFADLTPLKYGAILADPPWAYAMRSEKGYAKSPESHYPTMSPEAIKSLPVADLAGPDCYLFLWSTWPHLPLALDVMKSWGFRYVTGGAWIKRTSNWKLAFGTGYVLRSATEPFLVGSIGCPEIASRSERNAILAVADIPNSIDALRREHSRKPVEMRDLINRLLPRHHFAELFAREAWQGHDVWGNQPDRFGEADNA